MKIETLKSEEMFRGRVFTLRQDQVRWPDGRQSQLDILSHPGAVVIIPVDGNGDFLMVRQYRHAAGKELLEFPAGTLEPGEDPLACAARELQEETGFAAGSLSPVGGFFLAPGYSTEYLHIFLATGLFVSSLEGDEDEWLFPESVPVKRFQSLVESGQMEDAKSLAAYFLVLPHMPASETSP